MSVKNQVHISNRNLVGILISLIMQTLPKDGKVRKDTCPMHCGWYGCNMRTFLQCSAISLVPTGHQHGSSLNCPFLVYYHIVNQFLKATANTHQVSTNKKVLNIGRWSEVGGKTMRCVCNRGVFGVSSLARHVNLTSSVWPHGGSRFVPERRGRLAGHGRTLQVINKQTKRWRGIHCFQPIL